MNRQIVIFSNGMARRFIGVLAFAGFLLQVSLLSSRAAPTQENKVKAVFLFQFINYVEWPTNAFKTPTAPIVVGVLGNDPFGPLLDQTMKGEKLHGRALQVRRGRTVEELAGCHVLYVSESEERRTKEIINAVTNKPVLTVGDFEGFAREGGVMNYYIENDKVKFEANLHAASNARIKLSSQLLKLAKIVEGEWDGE